MSNTNKPYKILFLRLDPGNKENRALQGEELARIYQAIAEFNLFEVKDLDKSTRAHPTFAMSTYTHPLETKS